MLKSAIVINQLDNKFIICYVSSHNILLIFDQHAIDERRILEQLQHNYFDHLHGISVNKRIEFNNLQLDLLHKYQDILQLYYFTFEYNPQISSSSILIITVPILYEKKFITFNIKKYLLEFVYFIDENIHLHWKVNYQTIRPPFVNYILNSKACRSAIMFNDQLTQSQCQSLINSLSTCQYPFICAHGRTSVYPIALDFS